MKKYQQKQSFFTFKKGTVPKTIYFLYDRKKIQNIFYLFFSLGDMNNVIDFFNALPPKIRIGSIRQ